ncbi:hypothetical protein [Naasia sp. SYSU D00057]|uniref:hypothetical protein n=1 Tax=Naasia sp. SYSU D00057 TaxID=2817380 RepID=UPI001B3053F3|nr:hypothetical protein [Naasia sp. SYSU D00057]
MSTTSPEQEKDAASAPGAEPQQQAAAQPAQDVGQADAAPPRRGQRWRRPWVLWVAAALAALLIAGSGFAAGYVFGAGTAASASSGFPGDRGDRFGPRGDRVPPGDIGTGDTDTDTGETVPNS